MTHNGKIRKLRESVVMPSFGANIVDISAGGLRIRVPKIDIELVNGQLLSFHLEGARMKDDLIAQVLSILDCDEGFELNLKFFQLRELNRLKLKKFISRFLNRRKKDSNISPPDDNA